MMNIKAKDVGSTPAFLTTVWSVFEPFFVKDKPESHSSEQFHRFVETFFQQYPVQELVGRSWEDLYGLVFGLWQFLQDSNKEGSKIQVFNPSIEQHGWLSSRTIVTVLARDMPFVVDSMRMEINRSNMVIHSVKSTVLMVERNPQYKLESFLSPVGTKTKKTAVTDKKSEKTNAPQSEALVFLEISLLTESTERERLRSVLAGVLQDVEQVVDDYPALSAQVGQVVSNLQLAKDTVEADEIKRSEEFIQWLTENHFTFLRYQEYDLVEEDSQQVLKEQTDKLLGLAKKSNDSVARNVTVNRCPGVSDFYNSNKIITFAKSSEHSRVHRSAYSDQIVIKRFDSKGKVCGESRFSGLYTSAVYVNSPDRIPIIGEKIQWVLAQSGFDLRSYDGKYLRQVLETFPRDELFLASNQELLDIAIKAAQINERQQVRLFMRRGHYGKFVSSLVLVPRDLFSTRVRLKIQKLLGHAVGSLEEESTTYFSESILARVHMVFRVDPDSQIDFDTNQLQEDIIDIVRSWEDKLSDALVDASGEGEGIGLFNRYKNAFPPAYKEDFDARTAVHDIEFANSLHNHKDIAMCFYQPLASDTDTARFKIFRHGAMLELSDVIPLLEKMGLRVLGEVPYRLKPGMVEGKNDKANKDSNDGKDATVWLHDFSLAFDLGSNIDVNAARHLFQDAFSSVWNGNCESDDFNRLVLGARLNWREVSLLRAYSSYMKQTLFNFSVSSIAHTLVQHVDIARNLIALFKAKFDPRLFKKTEKDTERVDRLQQKIIDQLDQVENLNEDRILRRYLELMQATLRTNFFQEQEQGGPKDYISFKFSPRDIQDIPEPRPKYEIFVYSPRVEGVHLRGGKVARGGLRWSDRLEDFRTEVLGLVKAQQVKNAVIVPEGAKGGFVAKHITPAFNRNEMFAEGTACYKIFIRGLLDITDNLVDNKVVPPQQVARWDEDDPYLVVAADKGTATFSDTANGIAMEYDFWLGDAFASGGSQGYDHKGMGITAKGAWVSVQRHFKEVGINVQKQDFTVIGIGDMAGDVFGNGMLLSQHIGLVAAFNHLHIFIDPNPAVAKSFEERKRLFQASKSGWSDYDASLISAGGGVFLRSAKSIDISPEMQKCFDIKNSKMSPNDLINALLKAPVDLIWNGGIGTYIKASSESHADVGDKANDTLRINGNELRCKVFGEGGNLGTTQLGRIEFALQDGACNTDFIDNAAGVDCSDHEVNIKILLNELIANGDMTEKQRNTLLASMTDSVSELVLKNNYAQTQAISVAQRQAFERMGEYQRFISNLENSGKLNRRLEFIPDDEILVERQANGQALTRPELSVLISYAKVSLKESLNDSALTDDGYIATIAETAFPQTLREQYGDYISNHRLKREIVATQLANDMINSMGITFSQRLMESTGATSVQVAKAFVAARDVYQLDAMRSEIEALDYKIDAQAQLDLYAKLIRRVRRATRWFLRNRRGNMSPGQEIEQFLPKLKTIDGRLPTMLRGEAGEIWGKEFERLKAIGLSAKLATSLAMPSTVNSGLGMVEVSLVSNVSALQAAEVFTSLADAIHLDWFAGLLSDVKVENYWQAMARESYMDDLEAQMRTLAISFIRLMPNGWSVDQSLEAWKKQHEELVQRWCAMVTELQASAGSDFAMFSVALRELLDLAQASQHCEALTGIEDMVDAQANEPKVKTLGKNAG